MALDNYDFENLINEAETLILDELEKQLNACSDPLCKCNDCVVDMAAFALNLIKPHYRTSLMGRFYAASVMDQKAYADGIREAVATSIDKVWKNPGHEIEAEAGSDAETETEAEPEADS